MATRIGVKSGRTDVFRRETTATAVEGTLSLVTAGEYHIHPAEPVMINIKFKYF